MDRPKLCRMGHPLVPGNLTEQNECLKCYREKEDTSGLANKNKKTCPYGHTLSGVNLKIITDKDGHAHRRCVRCHAERSRGRYWNRIKALKHPRNTAGRPRKY